MNLSDRIQSALNAYYRDDADIDIMVGLLEECQGLLNNVTVVDFTGLDTAIENLKEIVKVQA